MNSIKPDTFPSSIPERKIYTVSQLTQNIKSLLEDHFPLVWVTGEISNFRMPASGHYYFTLKDNDAQINAVMFKGQNRTLKFCPEDGMKITGMGRISVYEIRGSYQIIFEYLEPSGLGALQAAFEQLKAKLAEEGLFDSDRKKPIPFLPSIICLITSPTGAVVFDMIRIIQRRFSEVSIEIIPVRVQGDGSDDEIARAIDLLNQRNTADVAILARGGGSLEDLAAFNSEKVARAIDTSIIPIISAVGHETDFTISDFVADLRAPTPSAAAELVIPVKENLFYRCHMFSQRLSSLFRLHIDRQTVYLRHLIKRLVHPKRKLDDARLRLDDISSRLLKEFKRYMQFRKETLIWLNKRLESNSPAKLIQDFSASLDHRIEFLNSFINNYIKMLQLKHKELHGRLLSLSPKAILERGYSITRRLPDQAVITNSDMATIGQIIEILFSHGTLICRVERKDQNGKNDI